MYYILSILLIIGLDQWSKYLAVTKLQPIGSYHLWPGVFHLTYAKNTGAAFSIFRGKQTFLILLTAAIIIVICGMLYKNIQDKGPFLLNVALVSVIGGAIGNLIDRVRLNYVIDYFDFTLINFAIFNVADIFVVCGSILLALLIIFGVVKT